MNNIHQVRLQLQNVYESIGPEKVRILCYSFYCFDNYYSDLFSRKYGRIFYLKYAG